MSDICKKCNKNIDDKEKTPRCDACRSVFHLTVSCSGLGVTEQRAIVLKERVLMFFCNDCLAIFKQAPLILNKIDVLEKEMTLLKDEIMVLKTEIKDLKQNSVNPTIPSVSTISNYQLSQDEVLNEAHERSTRACNIIVFKAGESQSDVLNDRIQHDRNIATRIMSSVGMDTVHLKKVIRLGKASPSKCRPLRMVLESSQQCHEIMRYKKKLSELDFIINYDKTKLQQEIYKRVANELRDRLNNGEKNIKMIYKNGSPTIVQSSATASKK